MSQHWKPLPAGRRHHPDGLDTLRLPAGKAIETHLEHLAEFWQPGTPPHQLAAAALAKIKQLEAERNAAWGQCAVAFGTPPKGKGETAARAAAVAEIERRLAATFPAGNALGVRVVGVSIDGDLASVRVVMPPPIERLAIAAPAANEDLGEVAL